MQSFLIFFDHRSGFLRWGQSLIKTRSHRSFSISINLVIPDYTGQIANLVSFSLFAWFSLELDNFSAMVGFLKVSGLGKNLWNKKGL